MSEPIDYWNSKAEEAKKAGRFEEAVKIFDKVKDMKKEKKEGDFWYKKAIIFCEMGEYEKAKEALSKDLEVNQKSYETFFLFGKIFYKLKKYEESLEYYNKASEEYSRQHLRNTLKIDQMKNVRKFEEAVKYSDLVNQQKKLDSDYWHHKGMVLFNLKKFQQASKCFEMILEDNPNQAESLYELAKSELWAGNKQKSYENLEKACKIEPRIKEKLKVDKDFEQITDEKQFQIITGL